MPKRVSKNRLVCTAAELVEYINVTDYSEKASLSGDTACIWIHGYLNREWGCYEVAYMEATPHPDGEWSCRMWRAPLTVADWEDCLLPLTVASTVEEPTVMRFDPTLARMDELKRKMPLVEVTYYALVNALAEGKPPITTRRKPKPAFRIQQATR